MTSTVIPDIDRFRSVSTIRLTSFRRDGTPVATPVSLTLDGDRAYVRTYADSGKFKRILRNDRVTIEPSTLRGTPLGTTVAARVRILGGADADHARTLIERRHPLLHRLLVPLAHRLMRYRTVYLELVRD